jgi:hypothetical protein
LSYKIFKRKTLKIEQHKSLITIKQWKEQVDSVRNLDYFTLMIGVFHAYFLIFVIMAMTSNGFLFYSLPFLELYPAYKCPPEIPNCTHRDRCFNKQSIEINYDSDKTLNNWVEKFNLECK